MNVIRNCSLYLQSCCSDEVTSPSSSQPVSDVENSVVNEADNKNSPSNAIADESWTEVNLNDDDDTRPNHSTVHLNGKSKISPLDLTPLIANLIHLINFRRNIQHDRPTTRRKNSRRNFSRQNSYERIPYDDGCATNVG